MKQAYKEAYTTYKGHGRRAALTVHKHALSTPKKIALSVSAAVLVLIVLVQFFYPRDMVVPFASMDSVAIGAMKKSEATKKLDAAFDEVKIPVYFSSDTAVKVTPHYADIGVAIQNEVRVNEYGYPWYMRVIPTSLLWYGLIDRTEEPTIQRDGKKLDEYFAHYFGADCTLEPTNATITVKDASLRIVPAVSGGVCDYDELHSKLEKVPVGLSPDKIVVKGTTREPAISDAVAQAEKERLEGVLQSGLELEVAGKQEKIAADRVVSFLEYTVEGESLIAMLKPQETDVWLEADFGKQLASPAGVTKVVTRDFTELSRVPGKNGQAIDTHETRLVLERQLQGEPGAIKAATRIVTPTVQYERSYSPTDEGLSALLKNYAESHPGSYGISLIELGGQGRRAEYNAGTQFTTASTYKLFVAYSTLLRIEDGRWRLSDDVNGRDIAKCLDDMIVLSDNPCAEALLKRIGYTNITNEARAIGATSTSFLGKDGIKSTARDEAVFMGSLYSGQLLSQQASRDRLLNALKRNVHRRGVPAGVPGIAVANKVGFLDDLLHDASIVYSPSGAYVLVVLTKGASWTAIADLAKQIEGLRNG